MLTATGAGGKKVSRSRLSRSMSARHAKVKMNRLASAFLLFLFSLCRKQVFSLGTSLCIQQRIIALAGAFRKPCHDNRSLFFSPSLNIFRVSHDKEELVGLGLSSTLVNCSNAPSLSPPTILDYWSAPVFPCRRW